jgi:hypothetical protein
MSKYTIVEKSAPGNQAGSVYTITYQVEGYGHMQFKTDLYCLRANEGDVKYCWLEGSIGPHINTASDKTEFLSEFYKFQKGGSYRKTHPIAKCNVQMLEEKKRALQKQVEQLERDIRDEGRKLRESILTQLQDKIDKPSLDIFINDLKNVFENNPRYYVEVESHIFFGNYLVVWDRVLNHKIKRIHLKENGIDVEDLDIDNIKI